MPRTTNTRAVTVAVVMATFLAALDVTVIGTAMPTIIGSLGGLALYSWAFSAYLLTSTAATPLCGRLADMYGRKPVFLAGAALFLAGSALCGTATSMEQLVLFRAIQGLGAGAVLPASITVVGDIFSIEQRAQVQGMLSGVWGISSIIGPAVGGLIVDRLDWRWVFYVNLPFGLVSMALFALFLHEAAATRRRQIDYVGAAGLTGGVAILLFGLLEMGQPSTGLPIPPWMLLALSAAILWLFLLHESRTEEPVLPLGLLRSRVISVSNAAGFLGGATLLGVSTFIPPFVQGVLGGTALHAGATLAPMSIGWPTGSFLAGRLILRHGFRPVALLGTTLILLGSMLLLPVGPNSTQFYIMFSMVVIGLGMGFSTTTFLVAVQTSVGWERRGVATASIQFFRTMGGAVGVAAMGALVNSGIREGLLAIARDHPGVIDPSASISSASVILDPAVRASIPAEALDAMRSILASSLHSVYLASALAAICGLALTFLFPRLLAVRRQNGPASSPDAGPQREELES